MIFTSRDFLAFLVVVLAIYWLLAKQRTLQNFLLLVASYVFYGWIHPWFCILIGASTLVDWLCGLGMVRRPGSKHVFLGISLLSNLGMLSAFKYWDFFATSVRDVTEAMGLGLDLPLLQVMLPVGISFYTFQTLSYTIDIYRGQLEPRRNLLDFAVFVSFFPQLVAGPIERATHFLPQVERARVWCTRRFASAIPLLLGGYLKKTVVADNLSVYVDQIFLLRSPSVLLLFVGALAFAFQIYADFSAYTDIARAVARMLGFELIENFRAPYSAISPSDFWRRWHISFSSWIRDYLYIPLGGSRVKTSLGFLAVLLASLGLSGLWHGAAWNFVLWGIYHALLVFGYHRLGLGGRWTPKGRASAFASWTVMFTFTLFGWLLFRMPSLDWLTTALSGTRPGWSGEELVAGVYTLSLVLAYALPLLLLGWIQRMERPMEGLRPLVQGAFYGAAIVAMIVLAHDGDVDFIYFLF